MNYYFSVAVLFAQIEERIFTDTNITEAYKEVRSYFSDSYCLPQSIESMQDITQIFDDEKSKIYGYKDFNVQWQNKNVVIINLNAFSNGERFGYGMFKNLLGLIERCEPKQ